MTVLIDPPRWPAHGTLWSHLVSDVSLGELHAFAERLGLTRRAFDLDHYDVAAQRYDDAVAAGAVPVAGRELIARLAASGLRVAGRDRQAAKVDLLAVRWRHLLPGAPRVGAELVDRWQEPHRVYHGPEHLVHALDSLAVLEGRAPGAPDPDSVPGRSLGDTSGNGELLDTESQDGEVGDPSQLTQLAVWFHDAVHEGVAGRDEEESAALARRLLSPVLGAADIDEVARLVLVTAEHDPDADDRAGALVSDADLAVLGGAPDRYARYVRQVRAEYANVPDADFRAGRARVLDSLLSRGPVFRTPLGVERWEARARENLSEELRRLR